MSWKDILKEDELDEPFKYVMKWKGKYYRHYDTKTSSFAPQGIYYVYWPSNEDGNLISPVGNHEIIELALDLQGDKIIEGEFSYVPFG